MENASPEELWEKVYPSESAVQVTEDMFKEALIPATQTIINVAAFSKSDKLRLDAAKYIIERNLGKVASKLTIGDKWDELLEEITKPAMAPGASDGNPDHQ